MGIVKCVHEEASRKIGMNRNSFFMTNWIIGLGLNSQAVCVGILEELILWSANICLFLLKARYMRFV